MEEDNAQSGRWTVHHIYRGLVSKALAGQWDKAFRDVPKSIAHHVSRFFCRFIEKEGREKIWKPRRDRTIEWEKQQGITKFERNLLHNILFFIRYVAQTTRS